MKQLLNYKTWVAAAFAIAMIGCNTNDPLEPDPTPAPNAPTDLMAQSVSESSVRVKWIIPSGTVTPTGYHVMATEVAAAGTPHMREVSVNGATTNSAVVGGLTEGKIYEFSVHAVNDTTKSPTSNKVSWAAARRATGTFKLYSSLNSANGSGLRIFGAGGPAVLRINQGGEWDICFDDKFNPADPRIGSPGQSAYVDNEYKFPNGSLARTVFYGKRYTGISSLDDIYESVALNQPTAPIEELMFQLSTIGGTANWGVALAWKDASTTPVSYWYGKVVAKRVNSSFVQGTGTNAFVELELSYQNAKDLPYALKQRIERHLEVEQGHRSNTAR